MIKLKQFLHSKGFSVNEIINFLECLEIRFQQDSTYIAKDEGVNYDPANYQWLRDDMFSPGYFNTNFQDDQFSFVLSAKGARDIEIAKENYEEYLDEKDRQERAWHREQDMLADAAWLGHTF